MLLQFGQVVEGIDAVQFAGVDQAHEQVADAGAVLGLVEVGIFAMKDGLLEGLFADVVVQGGPGGEGTASVPSSACACRRSPRPGRCWAPPFFARSASSSTP